MNKNIKKLLTGILILSFVSMFAGFAIGGDVTIVGTVNDENQLVDNAGTVYEVADNEKGQELMGHVGKKIQVMGTVMEGDDGKLITITSYSVIEE
ncbi:MAG: hypothetical protein V2I56_18865 [Desulfobacteraceae bacterium]|jgi:hypothetical protein|nr:hypothetical protein [Desulfobacteraceae bacterium]